MSRLLIASELRAALGEVTLEEIEAHTGVDSYDCVRCGGRAVCDEAHPASLIMEWDANYRRLRLGHPSCVQSQMVYRPALKELILDRASDTLAVYGVRGDGLPFLVFESAAPALLRPLRSDASTLGDFFAAQGFARVSGSGLDDLPVSDCWCLEVTEQNVRVVDVTSGLLAFEGKVDEVPEVWFDSVAGSHRCLVLVGHGLALENQEDLGARLDKAMEAGMLAGVLAPLVEMPVKPEMGHIGPDRVVFGWADNEPVMSVDLAFFFRHGPKVPVSPENWGEVLRRARLHRIDPTKIRKVRKLKGWKLEFGPSVAAVRMSVRPHGYIGYGAGDDWLEAVRLRRWCTLLLNPAPTWAVGSEAQSPMGGKVRLGGTYPASPIDKISQYHLVLLEPDEEFDPSLHHSFILDVDVVIDIERLYFEPRRLGALKAPLRELLINLAYHDVIPGLSVQQLRRPARTVEAPERAARALEALNYVRSASREQIEELFRTDKRSDPERQLDHQAALTEEDVGMLIRYAGVLKMRALWHPGHSLAERFLAFEQFIDWIRSELQVADAYLTQVAVNLWLGAEGANRQAAKLLKFRRSRNLDQLWGSAADIVLLSMQGYMAATEGLDLAEPVLITRDRGLSDLRHFIRPVGSLTFSGKEDESQVRGLVGVNLTLHPQLECRRERIVEILAGPQLDQASRLVNALPRSLIEPRVRELLAQLEREAPP